MLPRKETFLFAFCLLALAHSAVQVCHFGSSPCTNPNAYCNGALCACNAGYSGDGVTCTRVCPGDSTTKPGNGTAGTCTSQKLAGQTCAMTCNSGYFLSSGNLTRVCGSNGTWSTSTAVCSPKDCGPLNLPAHAYADPPCTSTTYKSWCAFSCEAPNYVISGQRNYTCNANGVWERASFFPLQNGQCISISCGDLPLPDHAVADPPCTLTTKGNTCAFNCLPPYVLVGQRNYTCSNFLSWERSTLFPMQDGDCVASAWNGVIKGSIVGNYTNGCTVQSLTTLANYTFLLTCPNAPRIAYLTFYQQDLFTVAVQNFPIEYGGVNYISSSSSTVQSIWLQSRSTIYTKGTSNVLTPTARTILYSKYLEECWFDDIDKPVQDFQRCEAPLWCYFRGLSPQAPGQRGQCWYPTCKPQYCNATVTMMRDGYCHNNGTGYECRSYLAPGATGCGGYTAGAATILPACDPFTSYCLNVAGVNTCVLSSCLVGGCNYGRACNYDFGLGTDTCTGQGIPKIPDPWVKEFLAEVLPVLPLSKTITTQAVKSKRELLEDLTRETNATAIHKNRESLMMMPRMRETNSRSADLFLTTPCNPGVCPVNQICLNRVCSSPSGTPCGPTPC